MKIIVGLGNPGEKYKLNRHNIGFMVLDWICEEYEFTKFLFNKRFNALVATGKILKWPVILTKPQTFMNLSGESVVKVVNFYRVDIKNILVIHDDLDLSLGRIKLKFDGSFGGHKGVKNIIGCLKSDRFWRLKIGIGRPNSKDLVVDYVLSDFKKEEFEMIKSKRKEIFTKIQEWFRYIW